jgi:hypothetical protein
MTILAKEWQRRPLNSHEAWDRFNDPSTATRAAPALRRNFLQHVFMILKQHGRAHDGVSRNVFVQRWCGETLRRELLEQADRPGRIAQAMAAKAEDRYFAIGSSCA